MKKILFTIMASFVMAMLSSPVAAAIEEKPIITIHTRIYEEVGPSNIGSLLIGTFSPDYYEIDFGWGANEYEVEQAYVDQEMGQISGTRIPTTVSEEGLIRIYGDPSNIDVLDLEGLYVTSIEMDECRNIEVLDLSHNALESLDLTPFKNLYAISLTDNPFTKESPLVVGAPKPYLTILEIDIINYIDENFNFSDYPSLKMIDAYANYGLKKADVRGCSQLLSLSLELTAVDELDLSGNPLLYHLNIGETRITDIDLSHTPLLQRLYCQHYSGTVNTGYHLNSIDVTPCTELLALDLSGNYLSEIDLSNNLNLNNLALCRNNLEKIDLSNNEGLYSVDLMYNNLDFATLPYSADWGEYWYRENDMPVARSIKAGESLDLSSRVLRPGTETTARVMRRVAGQEDAEVSPFDYIYKDGVISFPKAMADSVYVAYSNSLLNEYDLCTTPFMVKSDEEFGKPSRVLSFVLGSKATEISFSVGMDNASADAPRSFWLDLGDGQLVEMTTSQVICNDIPNIAVTMPAGTNRHVDLYIPEGDVLTSFAIENVTLSSINLTAATELRTLSVKNAKLYSIDLSYNRCLTDLVLSGNQLSSLSLAGIGGGYEKNVLSSVDASHNSISSVNIVATTAMRHLNLAYNKISEISLKDFDNIETIDLSNNKIEGELNLAYLNAASEINLANNLLDHLVTDNFTRLERLNISGNRFTFASLPNFMSLGDGFVYAPQNKLQIYKKGPALNLSAQNVVVNGVGTSFIWKNADGANLLDGTDFTCENGVTKFLKEDLGEVYCLMTNPAFPQFTGENALTTTMMLVMGAPTTVVASFTTLEDSDNGSLIFTGYEDTELYIDWSGNGDDYVPYSLGTSYANFGNQHTYAGANVKVYTYESPDLVSVFSVNGMRLADFNGLPLVKAHTITVSGCGLDGSDILLPHSDYTEELNLSGNRLSEYPFFDYFPNLSFLVLSDNLFTSFDASRIPSLMNLVMSNNQLTSIHFDDNTSIWNLMLENNQLESIELSGVEGLSQLFLSGNKLSSIDLSPVSRSLMVLSLVGNRFTFATLPVPTDYTNLLVYYYGKQANLEVECNDMKVDLSSQAYVNDVPTTYYWFLDEIVEDLDSGTISGEELIPDEEYTIENGITSFLVEFKGQNKVMCVLQNSVFPNTYMRTDLMNIASTRMSSVLDGILPDGKIDVYTVDGRMVRIGVDRSAALEGLEPGIYIIGGRKVVVTRF